MSIKTKEELKKYFETEDMPSAEEFSALIDSFLHINELQSVNLTKASETEAKNGLADDRYMTPKKVYKAIVALTRLAKIPELFEEIKTKLAPIFEPTFNKKSAFNKDFGFEPQTVLQGSFIAFMGQIQIDPIDHTKTVLLNYIKRGKLKSSLTIDSPKQGVININHNDGVKVTSLGSYARSIFASQEGMLQDNTYLFFKNKNSFRIDYEYRDITTNQPNSTSNSKPITINIIIYELGFISNIIK